jgi:apolipoprotein N-acyltransferase
VPISSRPSSSSSSLRREGLAATSGLLLVLSFPKFGQGVVAWVALVPLLVALRGTSGWMAVRLGYLTGAVSAFGLLYWTSFVVVRYGGLPLAVGAAIMAALCLAVAVFPALFAWALARALATFGAAALLGAPFLWVATELLRAHTLFEFPWCLLGYSQYRALPITAVYGVSFLVVAASALLAFAFGEPRPSRRGAALVGLVLLVGGAWTAGAWAMGRPRPETGRIRVGLVQASVRQDEKWAPGKAWDNVRRHLVLTEEAAGRGARLVVWPESAVPYLYDEDPALAGVLRRLVRRLDLYLFFGNDDRGAGPRGEERIFVGAKLLTPRGHVVLRYHKIHLVPFGEYVPLKPLFTLGGRLAAKLVREVSDFSPGSEPVLGTVEGHPVGGYICYEAIFPDLVRRFTARGAELLINVTNDAWYGTTSAPYQHLAMAVFRAVENRRYMVRAANTGITAVVDPVGRVREQTALFQPTVLVRDVAFVAERSFYARHGDVFAQACAAVALALLAATVRRRRR